MTGLLAESSAGVSGLAICALIASTISACTAIANFILTRVRLPKVRLISDCSVFSGPGMMDHRKELRIDILNSGAAIWDLEVSIEIWVPPWEAEKPEKTMPYSIIVPSVGEPINPLNGGQAQEFLLTSDFFVRTYAGQRIDARERYASILKTLPPKYVSLCIWSNKGRTLLRRLKSRRIRWHCFSFFDIRPASVLPLRMRLANMVLEFRYGARGQRLAKKTDKWRPGWFKLRTEQLENGLRGEGRRAR